ncbi:MAG: HNH endonuclease [Promethearchaeota archaeon]
MYVENCDDCLFQSEPGCTDCRKCAYCGRYLYRTGDRTKHHFDHILARSSGGKTVVPTCETCNLNQGPKGLKKWLRYLKNNYTTHWNLIVEHNKRKRNRIAKAVRTVRDE